MKKKRSKESSKPDKPARPDKDVWVTKKYEFMKQNQKNDGLSTISDFASRLSVHPQTLRNWEKANLLLPRRIGRDRVYGEAEFERAKQIKRYAHKGISLKGIAALFKEIS